MSPSQWVIVVIGFVLVCWVAGLFMELANHQHNEAQANADMEAMLKDGYRNVPYPPLKNHSINTTMSPDAMHTPQQRILSASLYDLAMRLTDAGAKDVDALIEAYCEISGVKYPPQKSLMQVASS